MSAPKCPVAKLLNMLGVVYLHFLLLLGAFGLTSARESSTLTQRGGSCPFAPRTAQLSTPAFQSTPAPSFLSKHTSAAAAQCPSRANAQVARTTSAQQARAQLSEAMSMMGANMGRPARDGRKGRIRPLSMSAVEDQPAVKVAVQQLKAVVAAVVDDKAEKAKRKLQANTPLQVHVIGLSHHNAAVEVRERLAVPEAEWNLESARLCENDNIVEAAVLSTCNRFEVYIASHDGHAAIREAILHLQQRSGLSQATLRRSLFMLSSGDAVWHILRVSAGLDSLVVGEGQILSQVRQCYLHGTEEEGFAGKVVARLLNTAVSAGKRVRSETSISKGAVSISSAAAEFSKFRADKDLHKQFEQCRLTIVGAGTMARLLVIHLQSLGIKEITLVNRSMPKCLELQAEFPDIKFNFHLADQMEQVIMQSDVVYTSTSAKGCIVTQPQLEALRAGSQQPVMFVDISVPRNVESECNDVPGVYAYDVDDLKMVVARNTAMRRKEMLEAEAILHEEQSKFHGWQQSLTAIPAISKMQEKFESMRADEVRKAANKLAKLSPKEMEVVEKLSKGIVNKMLHGPMSALRQPEGPEEKKRTLSILKAMFKLEKDLD